MRSFQWCLGGVKEQLTHWFLLSVLCFATGGGSWHLTGVLFSPVEHISFDSQTCFTNWSCQHSSMMYYYVYLSVYMCAHSWLGLVCVTLCINKCDECLAWRVTEWACMPVHAATTSAAVFLVLSLSYHQLGTIQWPCPCLALTLTYFAIDQDGIVWIDPDLVVIAVVGVQALHIVWRQPGYHPTNQVCISCVSRCQPSLLFGLIPLYHNSCSYVITGS